MSVSGEGGRSTAEGFSSPVVAIGGLSLATSKIGAKKTSRCQGLKCKSTQRCILINLNI